MTDDFLMGFIVGYVVMGVHVIIRIEVKAWLRRRAEIGGMSADE